tara:strand:+ start:1448 stop:7435 length:5988 start_codon:yes stop_codon:yes gene_type:complete
MPIDEELEKQLEVAVANGATKEDIVSLTKEYQKKKDEPTVLKESSSELEVGPSSSEQSLQTETETEPQGGPRISNDPVFTLNPGETLTPSLSPDFFKQTFSEDPNVNNNIKKVAEQVYDIEEFDDLANRTPAQMEWGPTEFELPTLMKNPEESDISKIPEWQKPWILGGRDFATAIKSSPQYFNMVKESLRSELPIFTPKSSGTVEYPDFVFRPSKSSAIYKIKDENGEFITVDSDIVDKITQRNREAAKKRLGVATDLYTEALKQDKDFEERLDMKTPDQDFLTSLREGKMNDVGKHVYQTLARFAPSLAATIITKAPPAAAYTTYGLVGASQSAKEAMGQEWFEDLEPLEKVGYVSTMGALEAIPDAVTQGIFTNVLKKVARGQLKKEVFDKTSKEIFKGMALGNGYAATSEFVAEGATGFGQSITEDVYRGVPVDLSKAFRRGINDGLLGLFSGPVIQAPATISDAAALANSIFVDAEVYKAKKDVAKYQKLASESNVAAEKQEYVEQLQKALDKRAQRTTIKRDLYQTIGKKSPKALNDLVKINLEIQKKINSLSRVEDAATKKNIVNEVKQLKNEFDNTAGPFVKDYAAESIIIKEGKPVTPRGLVADDTEKETLSDSQIPTSRKSFKVKDPNENIINVEVTTNLDGSRVTRVLDEDGSILQNNSGSIPEGVNEDLFIKENFMGKDENILETEDIDITTVRNPKMVDRMSDRQKKAAGIETESQTKPTQEEQIKSAEILSSEVGDTFEGSSGDVETVVEKTTEEIITQPSVENSPRRKYNAADGTPIEVSRQEEVVEDQQKETEEDVIDQETQDVKVSTEEKSPEQDDSSFNVEKQRLKDEKESVEEIQSDYEEAVGEIPGKASLKNVTEIHDGQVTLEFIEKAGKLITKPGDFSRYQENQGFFTKSGFTEKMINKYYKAYLIQLELEKAGLTVTEQRDFINKMVLVDSKAKYQQQEFAESLGISSGKPTPKSLIGLMNKAGINIQDLSDITYALFAPLANEIIRASNPQVKDGSGMSNKRAKEILEAYGVEGLPDDMRQFGVRKSEGDIKKLLKNSPDIFNAVNELYKILEGTREIMIDGGLLVGPEKVVQITKPKEARYSETLKKDVPGEWITVPVNEMNNGPDIDGVVKKEQTIYNSREEAEAAILQRRGWSETFGYTYVPLKGRPDDVSATLFPGGQDPSGASFESDLAKDNVEENTRGEEFSKFRDKFDKMFGIGKYNKVTPERKRKNRKGLPPFVSSPIDSRVRDKEGVLQGRKTEANNIIIEVIADRNRAIVNAGKNRALKSFMSLLASPQGQELLGKEVKITKFKPTQKVGYAPNAKDVLPVRVNGDTYLLRFPDKLSYIPKVLRGGNVAKSWVFTNVIGKYTGFLRNTYTTWNPNFWIPNLQRDMGFALVNLSGPKAVSIMKYKSTADEFKVKADVTKMILPSMFALANNKSATKEVQGYVKEFQQEGAMTGFISRNDQAKVARSLMSMGLEFRKAQGDSKVSVRELTSKAQRFQKKIVGSIETVNTIFEGANRLATFITARRRGASPAKAAELAKEISVNFNQSGSYGSALGKYFFFFNASMQGSNAAVQAQKKRPDNKRINNYMMGGLAAIGGAVQFLNILYGDDDEEIAVGEGPFKDLVDKKKLVEMDSDFNKATKIGYYKDDKLMYWNLPYGYNVPILMGKSALDVAYRKYKDPNYGSPTSDQLLDIVKATMNSFSPISIPESRGRYSTPAYFMRVVAPSGLKPLVDVWANENFMGNRIYTPIEELKRYEQNKSLRSYTELTDRGSSFSRWLSDFIKENTGGDSFGGGGSDVSPEAIDFIGLQMGGGTLGFGNEVWKLGEDRAAKGLEPLGLNKIPFVKSFVRDVNTSFIYNQQYKDAGNLLQTYEDMLDQSIFPDYSKVKNIPKGFDVYKVMEDYADAEEEIAQVAAKRFDDLDETLNLNEQELEKYINLKNTAYYKDRNRIMKNFMARHRNDLRILAEAAEYRGLRDPDADPSLK